MAVEEDNPVRLSFFLYCLKIIKQIRYIVMEVKINVPDNLSDITLGQYQKYLAIEAKEQDENFLAIKLIEIFCNVPSNIVMNMSASDVAGIVSHLTSLFDEKPELVRTFKMDGVQYGFEPDLTEIKFGAYVDVDTYIGDMDSLHIAMNALYRPISDKYGERYNLVPYDASDPLKMKSMPLEAAFSAMIFFYRLGMDLSSHILSCLEESEENRLVQYLNSEPSGVGINQFTHLLKEMLDDLKISLN